MFNLQQYRPNIKPILERVSEFTPRRIKTIFRGFWGKAAHAHHDSQNGELPDLQQQTEGVQIMNVKFYLMRGDVCPRCAGSGQIENNFWRMWQNFPAQDADLFWQKCHQSVSDLKEKESCPDCFGSGEIRSETTLADALAELGKQK